jgi:hypothetical protein
MCDVCKPKENISVAFFKYGKNLISTAIHEPEMCGP